MSSYLPTLKQLQYPVALKEQGHFGKAADACFVTQSTLSAGIRELESLIGVTLVADGLQFHIPRGYLYFAVAFSAAVEVVNLLRQRNRKKAPARKA